MEKQSSRDDCSNLCYLCGETIADADRTNEHFVSRVFYLEGKLPNAADDLSLPAHRACNASTSKDEERFAHTLAIARHDGTAPKNERWNRAVRALSRPEARGFREKFLAEMVETPDGGALLAIGENLPWVLARICKALWFKAFGTVLGADVEWTFRESSVEQFWAQAAIFEAGLGIPDVIHVRWGAHEASRKAVWWIAFHNHHVFHANTVPLPSDIARTRHTGVRLAWPKRNTRARP